LKIIYWNLMIHVENSRHDIAGMFLACFSQPSGAEIRNRRLTVSHWHGVGEMIRAIRQHFARRGLIDLGLLDFRHGGVVCFD
jgi:hypothetical protein